MDSNLTEDSVRKRSFSRLMAINELRKRGAKPGKDFFINGRNPTPEKDLKDLLVKDLKRRKTTTEEGGRSSRAAASRNRRESDSSDEDDSDSSDSDGSGGGEEMDSDTGSARGPKASRAASLAASKQQGDADTGQSA